MIAKQKIHRNNNFMGAFDYNNSKMSHKELEKRAELLSHNFVEYNRNTISSEIDFVKALRPNLTRDAYHVSLNFSKCDCLNKQKLLAIGKEYMYKMGFDENLFALWQHYDAKHTHIHLLVSRIKFDGSVVSDSNNYKKSESICRELEKKYKLTPLKPSLEDVIKQPTINEKEMMIRTNKLSFKMEIQKSIIEALSKSETLSEFIQKSEKLGVNLLFNQASTGRISGISFVTKDLMIKGQNLGLAFKWSNISKNLIFDQNKDFLVISETNNLTRQKFPHIISNTSLHNQSKYSASSNNGFKKYNKTEYPNYFNKDILPSLFIDIARFFDNGSYSKDGLNSKRNNKKGNCPRL